MPRGLVDNPEFWCSPWLRFLRIGCGVLMTPGYKARGCERPGVVLRGNGGALPREFRRSKPDTPKNWVMTGRLLQIAAFGADAFSVDNGRQ
jgi:hypothetical protein